MKKATILLLLFIGFTTLLYAQNFKGKQPLSIVISEPQKELKIKETLRYSMQWFGFPVGNVTLKTEGIENINGYPCYHITARVMPNSFFVHFFDIKYVVHTYLDVKSLCSRRFTKVRTLDNESNYLQIDFDQENHQAKSKTWGSGHFLPLSSEREVASEGNCPTTAISSDTQDLLSSFYYFRFLKIEEGRSYPINIYYDQRNWPVNIKINKPFWREIHGKGRFPVTKIDPKSELSTYIVGNRDFSVLMSVDSLRIPIEFRFSAGIGSLHGILEEASE